MTFEIVMLTEKQTMQLMEVGSTNKDNGLAISKIPFGILLADHCNVFGAL